MPFWMRNNRLAFMSLFCVAAVKRWRHACAYPLLALVACPAQAWDVITEQVFRTACAELSLSEPQMKAASDAFARYAAGVEQIAAEAQRRRLEGWERLGISTEPDERPSTERILNPRETPEQRRAQNELATQIAEYGRVAEGALRQELLSSISVLLGPSQCECRIWLERYLLIAAKAGRPRHPREQRQDLMDVIDLRKLMREAEGENGELVGIGLPRLCSGLLDEASESTAARIMGVLNAYEFELEYHFQHLGALTERYNEMRKRAMASSDEAGALRYKRHLAIIHMRPAVLLRSALAQISSLIRDEIGDNQADAFEDRVNSVLFPVLYQRETPDRMYEWLADGRVMSPESWEAASQSYAEYLQARRTLRERIMQARLEFVLEGGHPHTVPAPDSQLEIIQRRLAEAQADRISLAARTNARFRELLPPDQTMAFDEHFKQVRHMRDVLSRECPP